MILDLLEQSDATIPKLVTGQSSPPSGVARQQRLCGETVDQGTCPPHARLLQDWLLTSFLRPEKGPIRA